MTAEDIVFYKDHCRVDEKLIDEDNPEYPFCSEECHQLWADTSMPKKENGKPILTIEQMQERLLEMAHKN